MSTATAEADTSDAVLYGDDTTFIDARATARGGYATTDTTGLVGAAVDGGVYTNHRPIFPFTLALGAGASISAAEIRITRAGGTPLGDYDVQLRRLSSGSVPLAAAADANYDAAYAGSNEGTIGNTASWSAGADKTINVAAGSVNANGTTYYALVADYDGSGTDPFLGDPEDYTFSVYMADDGTSAHRPLLSVTYTLPGGQPTTARVQGVPFARLPGARGARFGG